MCGKSFFGKLPTVLFPLALLTNGAALSQDIDIDRVLRELETRGGGHPEFSAWPDVSDDKNTTELRSASERVQINPDRSLLIRERSLLSRISFQEVMAALAIDPRVELTFTDVQNQEAAQLFAQWMSTADLSGDANAQGLVCKDNILLNGINKPYTCKVSFAELDRNIGNFQEPSPAGAREFKPRAAVNRFDIGHSAETLSESCGEYRLIFQLAPEPEGEDLASFIFEPAIARDPSRDGMCTAIVRFWQNLGQDDLTADKVAKRLRAFFLEGIALDKEGRIVDAGFDPSIHFKLERVINRNNFGLNPAHEFGQIRTNTFSQSLTKTDMPFEWMLREYRVAIIDNKTVILPSSTKGSFLLDAFRTTGGLSTTLRTKFARLLYKSAPENEAKLLLHTDVTRMRVHRHLSSKAATREFAPYETISGGHGTGKDVGFSYRGVLGSIGYDLNVKATILAINERLYGKENSELTNAQRLGATHRVMALGCAGCHNHLKTGHFVGVVDDSGIDEPWRAATNFRHVLNKSNTGKYDISDYLAIIALPARQSRMQDVVAGMFSDW